MFEMLETAINSHSYFLLVWPAIYAIVFCVFVGWFEENEFEDDRLGIIGAFSIIFIIGGGLLALILCSESTAFGRVEIPGALMVFWTITGILASVGSFVLLIKRFLFKILL